MERKGIRGEEKGTYSGEVASGSMAAQRYLVCHSDWSECAHILSLGPWTSSPEDHSCLEAVIKVKQGPLWLQNRLQRALISGHHLSPAVQCPRSVESY
jgi:hypothetical protein